MSKPNTSTNTNTCTNTLPLVRTRFSKVPRSFIAAYDPSMTDQSQVDECDINNVILRFAGTGEFPPRMNARVAEYLDVSDVGDLHESLLQVNAARQLFSELPESVQAAVGYSPERLLEALDEHARIRASALPDVTKGDSKSEKGLDTKTQAPS